MHLGIDGGVFLSSAMFAYETGDEFCKSRGIKNAFILRCILYFFSTHARKLRFFKYPKRAGRGNFPVYLKNIESKRRDVSNRHAY